MESKQYTDGFKRRMVARMTGPQALSASALSREVGVPQPTLSHWLRRAGTVAAQMEKDDDRSIERRPDDWTTQEKLAAVVEVAGIPDAELGAWLRRRGLTEAHLTAWTELAHAAFAARPASANAAERKRVRELERELRRKEKALAETAALLVLQGKVQALWAAEDAPTGHSSDDSSSTPSRKRKRPGRA